MEEPEFNIRLERYRDELIKLLHKSQDSFEKQLSYISAGSLALSIGFIKDIVDINFATNRVFLNLGWGLLAATLLVNCVSHICAASLHNKTIAEINAGDYEPSRIVKRYRPIRSPNWTCVATLILGIASIIIFVSKKYIEMSELTNTKPQTTPGEQKGLVLSSPVHKPVIPNTGIQPSPPSKPTPKK